METIKLISILMCYLWAAIFTLVSVLNSLAIACGITVVWRPSNFITKFLAAFTVFSYYIIFKTWS